MLTVDLLRTDRRFDCGVYLRRNLGWIRIRYPLQRSGCSLKGKPCIVLNNSLGVGCECIYVSHCGEFVLVHK